MRRGPPDPGPSRPTRKVDRQTMETASLIAAERVRYRSPDPLKAFADLFRKF